MGNEAIKNETGKIVHLNQKIRERKHFIHDLQNEADGIRDERDNLQSKLEEAHQAKERYLSIIAQLRGQLKSTKVALQRESHASANQSELMEVIKTLNQQIDESKRAEEALQKQIDKERQARFKNMEEFKAKILKMMNLHEDDVRMNKKEELRHHEMEMHQHEEIVRRDT